MADTAFASSASTPVSFSGRGRDFLNMLIKGSLLLIPTFGFYRFWLVTKLRRHLWANTRIAGEPLEYTGTAKELLVGFLIALAILVPFYILYFIAGLFLEERQALASVPLFLVIYVFAHFAMYRARRYRASRTIFRGVRFWMTGRGWSYALRAILWDFAVILTLGLAMPWANASLERYRMRHTRFGTLEGDFTGTGWDLFKRGWWVWALLLGLLAGAVLTLKTLDIGLEKMLEIDPETASPADTALLYAVFGAAGTIGFVLMMIASSIFTRWQFTGLRFGEVAVSSDLKPTAFLGPLFKMIAASIGWIAAIALLIGVLAVITYFTPALSAWLAEIFRQDDPPSIGRMIGLLVATIAFYLVFLLGFGVINSYFLGRGLWLVVAHSLTVSNTAQLDHVVAAGAAAGSVGEGFADALDFEVGI